jgi:hypothetical protein
MNPYPIIISCDPGWSGSFVRWSGPEIDTASMPDDIEGISSTLKRLGGIGGHSTLVVIEQVGGFCGKGQPGSAMFRFGENFGAVLGAAIAHGYRVERVTPQKWMKAHGMGTRGSLSKADWKRKLKSKAQELYPQLKVTLETADALLILDAKVRGLI